MFEVKTVAHNMNTGVTTSECFVGRRREAGFSSVACVCVKERGMRTDCEAEQRRHTLSFFSSFLSTFTHTHTLHTLTI